MDASRHGFDSHDGFSSKGQVCSWIGGRTGPPSAVFCALAHDSRRKRDTGRANGGPVCLLIAIISGFVQNG